MDELQVLKMIAFYQNEAIRILKQEIEYARKQPEAHPIGPTAADIAEDNIKALYRALAIQQDYQVRSKNISNVAQ